MKKHGYQKVLAEFVNVMQVAEALPVDDASVDAVVGTLVLCSVKDVDMTLQGICVQDHKL